MITLAEKSKRSVQPDLGVCTPMRKHPAIIAPVVFIMLWLAGQVWAAELTGKWEASIMGHRIKAQAVQQGENLSGVAYLYDLFGNRSTWHFKGFVKGNKVVAAHHEGHVFKGDVTPDGRLVGVLNTNNGHQIPIDVRGSGR